jgi:predicted dehydrogenase
MNSKIQVGVVGCGDISDVYISNLQRFDFLEISACAAQHLESAQKKAASHGIPRALSVEALLADEQIHVVLNLTPPAAHFEIARAALQSGKSVYNEKPLAMRRAQGELLLKLATQRELRLGCAPDTFLGAGLQTCRRLIDAGAIGKPLGAAAFMLNHGMEDWHPNPGFFYQAGGGPLFDVGPYYLTALIHLLGPLRCVTGSAKISFAERVSRGGPRDGERFPVETPTHISALLEFQNGVSATLSTSFDVWATELPHMEIYGSEGTLGVPDPNTFGGPVRLWQKSQPGWQEVALPDGSTQNQRGLGLVDLLQAEREGRPHRANAEMALHVLDSLHAVLESAREGRRVVLSTTCTSPDPL